MPYIILLLSDYITRITFNVFNDYAMFNGCNVSRETIVYNDCIDQLRCNDYNDFNALLYIENKQGRIKRT